MVTTTTPPSHRHQRSMLHLRLLFKVPVMPDSWVQPGWLQEEEGSMNQQTVSWGSVWWMNDTAVQVIVMGGFHR